MQDPERAQINSIEQRPFSYQFASIEIQIY